ncbi:hypothetical protein Vadar_025605 [Vaccinium darrowii]|uniref:Uncharacterized protein n=1 Tax=Vaccinium darrowii TaxID=229202 RepID=A0ACB7Y1J6_9ERIC|nr:hypothetical protein Vadar_025605 [Vaccinium darrowii]
MSHYREKLTLYNRNDALTCKVFPSSLGGASLRWFDKLTGRVHNKLEATLDCFHRKLSLLEIASGTLIKRAASSIKELIDSVEKHAMIEEDNNQTEGDMEESLTRDNKKGRDGESSKGRSSPNKAITTAFKEPIYKLLPQIQNEPYFSWPPKMTGDPNKRDSTLRCSYHRDHGHMTES